MEKVSEKMEEQAVLYEELERFKLNLSKSPKDRLKSVGHLEGRLEILDALNATFRDNDRYIRSHASEADKKKSYFDNELYDQFSELFFDCKGSLNNFMAALVPPTSSRRQGLDHEDHQTNHQVHAINEQSTADLKLPHIAIPKFSGDYSSWLPFRDLFTSLIHSNSRVPPVQKMQYLKTCLVGEADKLVRHLNITSDNYKIAWDLLYSRYQNTRALVNNTLKTLLSQPHIGSENPQALRSLLDRTRECMATLNLLQVNTDNWDPIVNYLISERLPRDTRQLWEQSQGTTTSLPESSQLLEFLESRFRSLEATPLLRPLRTDTKSASKVPAFKSHAFHAIKFTCPLCKKNNHALPRCFKFGKMSVDERMRFIASQSICRNCMAQSHTIDNCTSKGVCKECNQRHHSLLHISRKPTRDIPTGEKASREPLKNSQQVNSDERYNGEPHLLRALIDPGSDASFITQSVLQRLRLTPSRASVKVKSLLNNITAKSNTITSFRIQPHSKDEPNLEIRATVLSSLTSFLPTQRISTSQWNHITQLPLADPSFNRPGSIDVILGAEVYGDIMQGGVIRRKSGSPTALKTSLGWILVGKYSSEPSKLNSSQEPSNQVVKNFCAQVKEECDMLKRFWHLEEAILPSEASSQDTLCEKLFTESHTRTPEGRYVVRLPFKPLPEEETKLGDSRANALKRLHALENRLEKDPQLRSDYHRCLEEYLEEGHMEKIKSSPPTDSVDNRFYLPHHAVQKTDSLTTKTRVVFDASSKSSNGYSLNDRLISGPALQRDIALLLFEWRQQKFAFTADIARMYRQVLVDYSDSDYQRILWRRHPSHPLEEYRLLTVTFGVSSAPFLAIRSLHQLAQDECQEFPLGAKILVRDFYVDDLFSGGSTLEEAIDHRNQIDSILKRGKFELRKWASNHTDIIRDILDTQRNASPTILINKESVVKTLGLYWIPDRDLFSYVVQPISTEPPFTKRKILSTIAKIYDPLGLLSLVIVSSKILLQSLWQEGLDWDDPVSEDTSVRWLGFIKLLEGIKKVSIPRFLSTEPHSMEQIHGFSDASQKAYGAALYLRSETNNQITSHLICAKTKVAPLKSVTLPRLELCGALLLSRLLKRFLPSVKYKINNVYAWTDSTIVLSWLRRHPNNFKPFVSNRISEIIDNVGPIPWRHVPSCENPADHASRGVSSVSGLDDKLWWNGPDWLSQPENLWPHKFEVSDPDPVTFELKPLHSFLAQTVTQGSGEILRKFSSLSRLLRVTAICKLFATRCRGGASSKSPLINTSHLKEARLLWIRNEQREHFAEELENLSKGNPISNSSKILNLNPFVDSHGLLRVGGRLSKANLPYSEKHPAILPANSHLTQLFIKETHSLCLHGGPTLTLSLLRKEVWILNARKVVKGSVRKCLRCFKNASKLQTQLMGTLPSARVRATRPFTNVGIDYAGPFHLRSSHLRGCRTFKGYVAIFICLCTKAIHIEAVSDLSTNAFLAAFRRFTARRGLCRDIYSDCGTTFVGAHNQLDKELKQVIAQANHQAAQVFNVQGIQWHFIPPASPHFGGLLEAGVKSIKFHLKRIAGNVSLNYEEMATLLTQIEACLNSRPLCPLTDDPHDTRVLTPGHFLVGDALLAPPEEDLSHYNLTSLKRWNLVQRLKQDFWRAWRDEYLSRLQQRPKWLRASENLKIGNLVLLKSENLPSNQWSLGRITKVHPGEDQLIRVVTVKTKDGEYKRPVTKISVLPIDSAN